jgi:hypothetical protein
MVKSCSAVGGVQDASQLKPSTIPPLVAAEALRKDLRLYDVFTRVMIENLE